ncbi:hypothetical protein GWK47_007791 [Chionoecetes opilio]|uniref:RING-type domain-containing protein n=1 Tax=Chionoecetes opilio TaxID=41210 RepID=A0A8J4Y6S4_CHIOP|nr:hypothetical protein GWK47_007791 [Chionoecetes opilio]
MAEPSLDLRPLTAMENLVGVQIESLPIVDGQAGEEDSATAGTGQGMDADLHQPLKLDDDDTGMSSTSPAGVAEASEGAGSLMEEDDTPGGAEESEAATPAQLPELDSQAEAPQDVALPTASPETLASPEPPSAGEVGQSSVENSNDQQVTESEPLEVDRAWTVADKEEEPSPVGESEEMLVQEAETMEGGGDSSASSGGGEGSVSGTGGPVSEEQFSWDTVHCVFCESSALDQEPKLLPCLHSACNKCLTHEAAEPEMNKDEDIVASKYACFTPSHLVLLLMLDNRAASL